MPDYPKRGRGRRHLNCETYSGCLAIAAAEGWGDFNCAGCPELVEFDKAHAEDPLGGDSFLVGQQKESSMQDKKPGICEECETKPVMSPGGKLCASCMARRANRNRKKTPGAGRPKGRPKKPRPSSPPQAPPQPGVKDYMDRMGGRGEGADHRRPLWRIQGDPGGDLTPGRVGDQDPGAPSHPPAQEFFGRYPKGP